MIRQEKRQVGRKEGNNQQGLIRKWLRQITLFVLATLLLIVPVLHEPGLSKESKENFWGVFFQPFVFSQQFEMPKMIVFYFFVFVFVILFILFLFFQKDLSFPSPFFNKYFKFVFFVFFVFLLLSTVFSISPALSFWGSYEHHQGLLFYLSLFFLAFLIIFLQLSRQEFLYFIAIPIILSGIIIAIMCIYPDNLFFQEYQAYSENNRIFGTFGQPNSLARFLLFSVFLSSAIIFSRYSWEYKILAAMPLPLILVVIWQTDSRATFLAIILGIILLILLEKIHLKWKVGFLLILFCLGSLLLFLSPEALNKITRSESIENRLDVWQVTPAVILEAPIFGHGLETFAQTYTKHASMEAFDIDNSLIVQSKAHNEILDLMAQIGILGSLSFFFFFIFIFWQAVQLSQKDPFFIGLTALLLGSFVARQLEFGTTIELSIFTIIMAYTLSQNEKKITIPKKTKELITITVLPLAFLSIYLSTISYQADTAFAEAERDPYCSKEFFNDERFDANDKAYWSKDCLHKMQLARKKIPWQEYYSNKYVYTLIQAGSFLEAYAVIKQSQKFNPLSANAVYLEASLLAEAARPKEANIAYEKAVNMYPNNALYLQDWSKLLKKMGKNKEADEKLIKIEEILRANNYDFYQ